MSISNTHTHDNAKELGFWVYLMSDAVIFALLFMTYASMSQSFAGGPTGRELIGLGNAFYETTLLLFSTLTCGLGMASARIDSRRLVLIWLLSTLFLGIGFIVLEIKEFQNLIALGAAPSRSGFWSAFFTLIGTHGLHVAVGSVWLMVMIVQIVVKGITEPVFSRLYRFSLFWHFLDLIWVLIFSVVYLAGVI